MGAPLLPGAVGFLVCEVERHVDGGDHVVLLGNVVHTKVAGGQPLTYHGRVFGTTRRSPDRREVRNGAGLFTQPRSWLGR
ncbi:flavin reductase [Microbispora siamensis]|uniref:Flavin reductase like domain-containing protein n=1 Tax=Microbispora siamensis TaxID=564413 RepID=A0ABQ4GT05_9ACTN|nr:hypothetical protein Msi02_53620 [Microbispora siamensis]